MQGVVNWFECSYITVLCHERNMQLVYRRLSNSVIPILQHHLIKNDRLIRIIEGKCCKLYRQPPSERKTDLYRAIVSRSTPPLKVSWLHLSCFAIKLAFAMGMNVKRLATVISNAFQLTFELVHNNSRPHDVTN